MSKPINENPNPAPRYPAPAIQIHPQNSRDATIARLTAEVERLRGGIDLIADERNRLAKRVADLESHMRLILHRCNVPARPDQVCHENPAEIARQALGRWA